MAYKLKPNYHFSDMGQTGIDKIPVGRFIVVEDVGNENEIKWYKKVSNNLLDSEGEIIEALDGTHTLNDAIGNFAIVAPLDEKRDVSDSYSQTEVDSMLTVKADLSELDDYYTQTESDAAFRRADDSYSMTTIDSLLLNPTGIVESAATISADYNISEGSNAMSLGPIVIDDNVTVNIPNNSVWQII
jgi:hypothetical protein